ncbi:MAG: metallophosphoesterase family protein [Methanomassiliicoccales archaeon]|nr:MAG: metallophosphoesterase family protein [Methanomassiliicoccales archaeon]
MKFIVISDVHRRDNVSIWVNRLFKEHNADGVIVLGDITHFGPGGWAEDFLRSLPGKVYAVPGNCDPPLTFENIARGAECIHARRVKIGEKDVVGFGGSNLTMFNTPNEMTEEHIFEVLSSVMIPGCLLFTHCPPLGINDQTISGHKGGSEAIRKIVERFKPELVLSGHIHEARGIVMKDGTTFMNPGAAKDGHAGILEITDKVMVRLLDRAVD